MTKKQTDLPLPVQRLLAEHWIIVRRMESNLANNNAERLQRLVELERLDTEDKKFIHEKKEALEKVQEILKTNGISNQQE